MTHSSLIKELAQDIAKLSKTLSTLAEEAESAPTQDPATEAVSKKATKSVKTASTSLAKEESSSDVSSNTDSSITIEAVRAVLAEVSQAGGTAKVKELLTKFGAAKLSAVDPSRYGELLAAANELK